MKKNVVKLNESQLRKVVAESVKKVLKEGYQIPNNVDFTQKGNTGGILPYIMEILKEFRAFSEKMLKINDSVEEYASLSNVEGNTFKGGVGNDHKIDEYYYNLYYDMFEKFDNALDSIWENILQPVETEIEKSVNNWGENYFNEKGLYKDFYDGKF